VTRKHVLFLAFLGGALSVPGQTPDRVLQANTFPGVTADQEIRECLAALPTGGICDARGFGATTQTIYSPVIVGIGDPLKQQTLILDPATRFVPASASTQLFAIAEGGSISGTLFADVTGVPGWNSSVISNSGLLGQKGSPQPSHIDRVICHGAEGTSGTCLSFAVSSHEWVSFVVVGQLQVEGMNNGISLSATETLNGDWGWVTGNWFDHVLCVRTQNCFNLQATGSISGTQVSQNHFTDAEVEIDTIPGLMAINATATGMAVIDANSWKNLIIFDASHGSNSVHLSQRTFNNQIEGALCLGACNYGTSYTDSGGGNVVIDWKNDGPMGGYMSIRNQSGAFLGNFVAGAGGPELDVAAGYDYRVYSGDGGLRVTGGTGLDHNLYLYNLNSSPGAAVFNGAVSAPAGLFGHAQIQDTGSYYPIYNASGTRQGYMVYGVNGPELNFAQGNDLRFYSGNGGLRVVPGQGTDHNLYLQNLDASGSGIFFNRPIGAGGGMANHVVCWKPSGLMGYCSTRPDSAGSCGCI
jgi:hypothetical protein